MRIKHIVIMAELWRVTLLASCWKKQDCDNIGISDGIPVRNNILWQWLLDAYGKYGFCYAFPCWESFLRALLRVLCMACHNLSVWSTHYKHLLHLSVDPNLAMSIFFQISVRVTLLLHLLTLHSDYGFYQRTFRSQLRGQTYDPILRSLSRASAPWGWRQM